MLHDQKHIHFIGICGVAMSALAIAFQKKGWKVTGSDKGFYPPVSTALIQANVMYYPGWHPEKMGKPDLVVVGNVASSNNPEWLSVKEQGIEYKSYPEVIQRYFIKKNSIVCAGTYGKSTSAALLSWIFKHANYAPSYMFGGISNNDMTPAEITDGQWSILEGDEYKTAGWDQKPKFFYYSPTHLLLTSAVWDHADVYPTEAAYDDAFTALVSSVPPDGLLVLSAKVIHEKPHIVKNTHIRTVTYGKTEENDYQYTNVLVSPKGVTFDIVYQGKTHHVSTNELGDYMADNMTGCFALAHEVGIPANTILSAFESFKSIKRRLERRLDGDIIVFDDIAHSPKKAEAVLRSLRKAFTGNIIAIFEPNTGNREPAAAYLYAHAFKDADRIIIPRLSAIKKDPTKSNPMDGEALAEVLMETHDTVSYLQEDHDLVNDVVSSVKTGDVIVFLGSHGFRGMIEQLISRLSRVGKIGV